MSALALPFRRNRATTERGQEELPAPLVKPTKHPLIWLRQTITLVLLGALLVHVGTLIIVALYYFLFGADGAFFWGYHAPLNDWWHQTVPDDVTRHMLRNVYEGVLGGTLGQLIVFNRYKIKQKKLHKRSLLDRIEIKLRIPNYKDDRDLKWYDLVTFFPLVVLYAAPGFWLGMLVMNGIKTLIFLPAWLSTGVVGTSWHDALLNLWSRGADQKLVGLFASIFMARRIIKGFADNVQGYFAAHRVNCGKPCRPWHPPNFKARCNGMTEATAARRFGEASNGVVYGLAVLIPFGLILAGLGWYILTYIA
jgi:hypothetical protein